MTFDEMKAVKLHPGWSDGRTGYLFCRVTACLTDAPGYINAEVVWMDDGDELDDAEADASYFDPQLEIETNQLEGIDTRRTHDKVVIKVSAEVAITLMAADPADILISYAGAVAELKIPNQEVSR